MINEERPVLIAQEGPIKGSHWMIDGKLDIGRDETCHVVIKDRQISRRHACIQFHQDGLFIEDLDSKNGTFLNGERLSGAKKLKDGDMIQIALAQEFLFVSAEATLPLIKPNPGEQETARGILLDRQSRQVWVRGTELDPPLSAAQFRLLDILIESEKRVISRRNLTSRIWGAEEALGVSNQALDALIRRLRDRIAEIDPDHNYVITVRGHGLKLENRR